jgi:predicted kinase
MIKTFDNNNPTIILLCGIPASGKSTWAKNVPDINYRILSTDKWLDNKAKQLNKNYSEVFNEYIGEALEDFIEKLYLYIELRKNIIVDQTNYNIHSRYKKLKLCDNYNKVAVYFEISLEDAIVRSCNRGRTVPRAVLEKYYNDYERPTLEEGFDLIIDGSLDT